MVTSIYLRAQNFQIPSDGPSCAECSLRFLHEDALQTHLSQHNADNNKDKSTTPIVFAKPKPPKKKWKDKYLVCELCGKLVRQSYMSSHIDEHYGKPYPCPFCELKFKNKKHWHQHKYRSHNEMGYRLDCEKCGRKMSTIDNLRVHIERVHTETPAKYICEYCKKAFRIQKDMKAHINHMHLHKPWPKRGKNREQRDEKVDL